MRMKGRRIWHGATRARFTSTGVDVVDRAIDLRAQHLQLCVAAVLTPVLDAAAGGPKSAKLKRGEGLQIWRPQNRDW